MRLPLQNLNTCILSKGYWDSMLGEDGDAQSGAFIPLPFMKKAFDDFAAKY